MGCAVGYSNGTEAHWAPWPGGVPHSTSDGHAQTRATYGPGVAQPTVSQAYDIPLDVHSPAGTMKVPSQD